MNNHFRAANDLKLSCPKCLVRLWLLLRHDLLSCHLGQPLKVIMLVFDLLAALHFQ